LFAAHGPDAVGLKEVAREAGVSHGLVTHYFGTYDALVEAALEHRVGATREAVLARLAAAGPVPEVGELLRVAFALFNDPVHVRLAVWAMLSGRAGRVDFFATRQKGMRRVADAVLQALEREGAAIDEEVRREVDFAILLAVCASYGYALGRQPFLAGLGRRTSAEEDEDFAERLGSALRAVIEPRRRGR
jgi:AcrR family transcriptional regulator